MTYDIEADIEHILDDSIEIEAECRAWHKGTGHMVEIIALVLEGSNAVKELKERNNDYENMLEAYTKTDFELQQAKEKLREREELAERLHKLCLEKIDDYELFEEYYLYKASPPNKEDYCKCKRAHELDPEYAPYQCLTCCKFVDLPTPPNKEPDK